MSDPFGRRDGELYVEDVSVARIAARFGTPAFVYSRAYLESRYRRLVAAFAPREPAIRYAVKANGNLAILNLFSRLGAGFDIVSGGELERVVRAGGDPAKVVFSGVGKTREEIDFALKLAIECFNVESSGELDRLAEHAQRLGRTAPVSIRVNPDIDANTHPYISTGLRENKFGVPIDEAFALYRRAASSSALEVVGIDCHIGSQIASTAPLLQALQRLLALHDELLADGVAIQHLDLGGGFGIGYHNEPEFDIEGYARAVNTLIGARDVSVMLEPGRFLVANGGILLTRVEYLKPATSDSDRNFAVVDAAMNDLIRPSLYQGWHSVEGAKETRDGTEARWDVVGPICESADVLARDRLLRLNSGDLLCVRSAGAYGFVQSSNYNSRSRAPEILVDGSTCYEVRRRETIGDQLALESVLPEDDAATGSLSKRTSGR